VKLHPRGAPPPSVRCVQLVLSSYNFKYTFILMALQSFFTVVFIFGVMVRGRRPAPLSSPTCCHERLRRCAALHWLKPNPCTATPPPLHSHFPNSDCENGACSCLHCQKPTPSAGSSS
jgi:hypothetical protein